MATGTGTGNGNGNGNGTANADATADANAGSSASSSASVPLGDESSAALDLAAALALAEARSLDLPAQAAMAEAARQRAVAAGQRPDPVLRIGLDNVPVQGSTDRLLTREPTTARSIGLVQALPDAAKLQARAQGFAEAARAALAQRDARRADLRRDTTLAWLAVRAESRGLALLAAQSTEAGLTVQAAEAAYRAGRGGPDEVFAARALPARLADQRMQAEARLATARSALRRWVGDAAERPLGQAALHPAGWSASQTAGLPTAAAVPPLTDKGTQAMADQHWTAGSAQALLLVDPNLAVAQANTLRAQAAVQVAREDRRSDWSVDIRLQQRGRQYDNMVSIGLSLPLRWDMANRQDREMAARQAELRQAEALADELRRTRLAQLQAWQLRWQAGQSRLALYAQQLLPLAAARTQAALAAYRAGSGTLQSVLAARQAELALQLAQLQIELDADSDAARLSSLTLPPEATP